MVIGSVISLASLVVVDLVVLLVVASGIRLCGVSVEEAGEVDSMVGFVVELTAT